MWISPECGPYSPLQHLNQRTEAQKDALQEKRRHALLQYEGASEIIQSAQKLGVHCVLEMSERCEGWKQEWCEKLARTVHLHEGVCKGCQVGLKNAQGVLMCKGWRLRGTLGPLIQHMSMSCDGRHPKATCAGGSIVRSTAFYTEQFAKRVCRFLHSMEQSWAHVALEANEPGRSDAGATCLMAEASAEHDPEEAPVDDLQDIPVEDRKVMFQNLKRIHSAAGHCSLEYLKRTLRRRGAPKNVMRCAAKFSCDVCRERQRPAPRPQSSLVEIAPKWSVLQCDSGTWTHQETGEKWTFMLGVDEGSRLRVGKILFQHQTRTPSAKDFLEFYEEQWFPHFGKPETIRLDPAGNFRSKVVDEYMSNPHVMLQEIPAEAHWQISLVERAIQTTKATLTALISEHPEMRVSEAFSRSLWAANTHDQHRGFSPLQHAFGRAPDALGHLGESKLRDCPILTENGISAEFGVDIRAMLSAEKAFLEEQAKARLERALRSGVRRMSHIHPGDLVFVWRIANNKKEGPRQLQRGKFLSPCRVLAVETRTDPKGCLVPGSVVWLYRGGNLIKAAPQQLRPATPREEALSEACDPKPIPWTISETLKHKPPHMYEDVTHEASQMQMDPNEDWGESLEYDPQRRVEERANKRQAPDPLSGGPTRSRQESFKHETSRPPASSSKENPSPPENRKREPRSRSPLYRGREVPQREALTRDAYIEECGFVFSEEPKPFWDQRDVAVEISVELPRFGTGQGKEWTRDLGCFFVKQLKRQNIEVREKHLTDQQKQGFKQAKSKEVKNLVLAQAFKALPEGMRPTKEQVLKMRWVLTWKFDEAPEPGSEPLKKDSSGNPLKPKARAVILGYMDPEYEFRPTSSPTMSRSSRQLFLQMAANNRFTVEKGDISGAFLQGDLFGPDRPMYCEPLPEILEALQMPPESTMLLTRAAYGLVEAPLQWYLSIANFLESIGGERQFSDPCVWGFFDSERRPIAWASGHVDDFMFFSGDPKDGRWMEIRSKIQERFKWGSWESGKFVQCGVLVEALENHGFQLSQPDYLTICKKYRSQDLSGRTWRPQ